MALRAERGVTVTIVAVVLAAVLAGLATQGLIYALAAVVLAAYLAFALTFGARGTGIACMMGAFALAPMYRGIEQLTGGLPPTDVFLIVGIIHLLPSFVLHRLKVPTIYLMGLLLMAVCSLISVMVTGDLLTNAFYAVQWLFFIGALPIIVAWWRPELKVVHLLLWSYLVGHLVSTTYGLAEGAVYAGRYDGLTHHPNAFGLAGVTAIAIVFYLFPVFKDLRVRLILAGFVAVSVLSITMSGSRAAIVVLVVLILMIPVVERSALMGVGLAALAAIGVLSLPFIVDISGEESAIGRLVRVGYGDRVGPGPRRRYRSGLRSPVGVTDPRVGLQRDRADPQRLPRGRGRDRVPRADRLPDRPVPARPPALLEAPAETAELHGVGVHRHRADVPGPLGPDRVGAGVTGRACDVGPGNARRAGRPRGRAGAYAVADQPRSRLTWS